MRSTWRGEREKLLRRLKIYREICFPTTKVSKLNTEKLDLFHLYSECILAKFLWILGRWIAHEFEKKNRFRTMIGRKFQTNIGYTLVLWIKIDGVVSFYSCSFNRISKSFLSLVQNNALQNSHTHTYHHAYVKNEQSVPFEIYIKRYLVFIYMCGWVWVCHTFQWIKSIINLIRLSTLITFWHATRIKQKKIAAVVYWVVLPTHCQSVGQKWKIS